MTEIDERIVAMHFDNKGFEKGAKQTIETLEQLKESCNFDESAESLNEFGKSVRDLDFGDTARKASKLGDGIKSIFKTSLKFTTAPITKLGSALGGLANDVKKWFGIDLARDIEQSITKGVKALTIEPINAGWSEYEMKMDSIKTIMSGTAKEFAGMSDEKHMGAVKKTLEELNRYADETIYSFKDMTANIGKFTNAGVRLDTAAKSMMGISNLAAKAGQGTQQASMAMYNFSQSMGLGYVELRDWRSIENANMATMEFKETLVELGLAMGTLKKDSKGVIKTAVKGEKEVEVSAEKLRESLNKKWLTSDVLAASLEIYSGDLSVKEIQQRLKVTKEQAQQYYEIGQRAKEAATQVRTFSKMWDALKEAAQSGWAQSFEYLIGDMNEATEFWSSINKRIGGWLEKGAADRNKILESWRGIVEDANGNKMKKGRDGRNDLIDTIHLVFDTVEKVGQAITKAWENVFGKLTGKKLQKFTASIKTFAKNISKWLGSIDKGSSRISKFSKILRGMFSLIKGGINIIKTVSSAISDVLMPLVDPIIDFCVIIADAITDLVNGNFDFDKFIKKFEKLGPKVKAGLEASWKVIQGWFDDLFKEGGFLHTFTPEGPIGRWFNSIVTTFNEWIDKFKKLIHWDEISTTIKNGWNKVMAFFRGEEVGGEMDSNGNKLKIIYGPSGFSQLIEELTASFNEELDKFKKLIHWDEIIGWFTEKWEAITGLFKSDENDDEITILDKISSAISNFVSPGEDGSPSQLSEHLALITSAITEFRGRVRSWSGWNALSKWFTTRIKDPIINLVNDEEGNPAKLKAVFDDIVTHVSDFFGGIPQWLDGLGNLWDFFKTNIIDPVRKVFDYIIHGDENYSAKQKKSKSPIGIIASSMVSDRPMLSRVSEQMTEDVQGIIKIPDLFKLGEGSPFDVISGWFTTLSETFTRSWTEARANIAQIKSRIVSSIRSVLGSTGLFNPEDSAFNRIVGWFKGLGSKLEEGWTEVKKKFGDIKTAAENFFVGEMKVDRLTGESVRSKSGLLQFIESIVEGFNSVKTQMENSETYKVVSGFFTNLWNSISGFFTKKDDTGTSAFVDFLQRVWNKIVEIGEGLGKNKIVQDLGDFFGKLWEIVSDFLTKTDETTGETPFGRFLSGLYNDASEFLSNTERMALVDSLLERMQGIWDSLSRLLFPPSNDLNSPDGSKSVIAEVAETLETSWTENKDTIESVGGELTNTLGSATESFNSAKSLIDEITNTITSIRESISSWHLDETISKSVSDVVAKIDEILSEIIPEKDETVAPDKDDTKLGFVESVVGIITSFLTDIKTSVQDWSGWDAVSGFITSATTFVTEITNSVAEFGGSVKEAWETSSVKKVLDSVSQTVSMILEFVRWVVETATSLVSGSTVGGIIAVTISGFIVSILGSISRMMKYGRKILQLQAKESMLDKIPIALLSIAGTIWLIAEAVNKLSLIPEDQWNTGLGRVMILGGVVVFMYAFIKFLKNLFDPSVVSNDTVSALTGKQKILKGLAEGLISWLAIFAILKWAVPEIIKAFKELDGVKIDSGTVWTIIGALASTILAVALLIPVFKNLGNIGLKGFVKIAEGILIAVGSLGLVLTGFAAIGAMATEFKWVEKFETLGKAFGALIGGFTGQKDASYLLAVLESTNDISKEADSVNTAGLQTVAEIAKMISLVQDNLPRENTVFEKWFGGGSMSLQSFADLMPKLGSALRDYRGYLMAFGDTDIDYTSTEAASTALMKISAALSYLDKVDPNRADRNAKVFTDFISAVTSTSEFKSDYKTFVEIYAGIGEAANEGIKEAAKDVDAKYLTEAIGLSVRANKEDVAKAIQEAIRDSALTSYSITNNGETTDVFGISNLTSQLDTFNSLFGGTNALDGIKFDGLSEKLVGALDFSGLSDKLMPKANEMATSFSDALNNFNFEGTDLDFSSFGLNFMNDVVKDVDANTDMTSIVQSMADSVNANVYLMTGAGYNLDYGLAQGIRDRSFAPINAMRELAAQVIAAAKFEFDQHSPSRVFNEIGRMNIQGLTEGTAVESGNALQAVHTFGDAYVLAMQQAMAPIDAILNDDFTFTPVITPIVDMTNLRNSANNIGGLFNNRYGINATLPSFTRNTPVPEVNGPVANNTQMVNAIIDRMDQMSEELHNMKIVLNTGALVGNTVAEYDRALGQRASKARRG